MARPSRTRLIILSRSVSIYSTRRLVEAARARGIATRVLNPIECEMHMDGITAHVYHRRKAVRPADVVIPRIAQSIAPYGLAVLNQLGLSGAVLLNTAGAIASSRNKMRSLQLLTGHGVEVPPTLMARDPRSIREMVSLVGGVPVLVKLLQGGMRQGVMVCETMPSLEAALEAILGLGQNVVIQKYVRDSKDRDVRALVVGGQVLCAVRRIPRIGKLSRTLSRGAKFEPFRLPAHFERSAIRAACVLNLEVAAVDMLEREGRAEAFEVHSSPGLQDLEAATGLDLAMPIIDRALALVSDAKARLPASAGVAPAGKSARRKPGSAGK